MVTFNLDESEPLKNEKPLRLGEHPTAGLFPIPINKSGPKKKKVTYHNSRIS